MSETKHTPGPWHYVECDGSFNNDTGEQRSDEGGFEIRLSDQVATGRYPEHHAVSVCPGSYRDEGGPGTECRSQFEEMEANVRIMAASPEMLEALELVKKYEPEYRQWGVPGFVEVVSAAIAKAKGRP